MTNSELQEYLSQFPDDAKVCEWGGGRYRIDEKDIENYIFYDSTTNEIVL